MARAVPQPLLIIGMGALSSLLFLSLLSGLPIAFILSFFCQVPLFYVALTQGPRAVLLSAVVASLCAFFVLSAGVGLMFFLLFGIPCILLTSTLLKPFSRGEKRDTRVACLVLIQQFYSLLVMTVLFAGVEVVLKGGVVAQLAPLLASSPLKALMPRLSPQMIEQFLRIVPGLTLYWTMLATLVSGVFVQTLLGRWNLSLVKKSLLIEKLTLPLWLWILLVVSTLSALFFSHLFLGAYCVNVLLVLVMVFLLQGVSIVHTFCLGRTHETGLLWTFYALVVLFQELALIVAVAGILEPWLHVRRRIEEKTRREK